MPPETATIAHMLSLATLLCHMMLQMRTCPEGITDEGRKWHVGPNRLCRCVPPHAALTFF